MARPGPKIIETCADENNVIWDITSSPAVYMIVYKNKPVGIRSHHHQMAGPQFKYNKMLYNTQATAQHQVDRLNQRFNTEDFSYIAIGENNV
jgi:hypothetical protein